MDGGPLEKVPITFTWDIERINIKFEDIKQISKLVEMLLVTMERIDEDFKISFDLFSLVEVLQLCLGFLVNECRRQKVEIKIEYFGIPKIRGDKLQIMRVFYNLLGMH